METARQGAREFPREMEFPTEWTMIEDGASWREPPQLAEAKNEELDSEEGLEEKKTPLVAHAHASCEAEALSQPCSSGKPFKVQSELGPHAR